MGNSISSEVISYIPKKISNVEHNVRQMLRQRSLYAQKEQDPEKSGIPRLAPVEQSTDASQLNRALQLLLQAPQSLLA